MVRCDERRVASKASETTSDIPVAITFNRLFAGSDPNELLQIFLLAVKGNQKKIYAEMTRAFEQNWQDTPKDALGVFRAESPSTWSC